MQLARREKEREIEGGRHTCEDDLLRLLNILPRASCLLLLVDARPDLSRSKLQLADKRTRRERGSNQHERRSMPSFAPKDAASTTFRRRSRGEGSLDSRKITK